MKGIYYKIKKIIIISFCIILMTGCQNKQSPNIQMQQNGNKIDPSKQIIPNAEIFFAVTIPFPIPTGEKLYLSVIDEVTGIPYNSRNFLMERGDDFHYYVALPFPIGSIVKYRFFRQGDSIILEDDFKDEPIRYRMYYVGGPGEVMDTVSGWTDSISNIQYGRITGQVFDGRNNIGIPDLLLTAAGRQTFTDSNGEFVLEGMPEGNQNLVVYSVDGIYKPFQQGAIVKSGKRTPIEISLAPADFVNVIFTVQVPENTVPSAPIKIAGNLFQLGNSFSDLLGGLSNTSRNLPELSPLPDGRFMFSIMLPEGADIRYKYTLGDGLLNSERTTEDNFRVRQLIVPSSDAVVEDVIETWQSGSFAPIIFDVTVPDNTPVSDDISIQFNPYVWTEPIQMWPLGNNRWVYQLFSPFEIFDTFEYTYCRNDHCNLVANLNGESDSWKMIAHSNTVPQNIQDKVLAWKWTSNYVYNELHNDGIYPRNLDFWTGLEFNKITTPLKEEFNTYALFTAQEIGSNTIVISPTWTLSGNNPIEFGLKPGKDRFGSEISETIKSIQTTNMNSAIFPIVSSQIDVDAWWMQSDLDIVWWNNWFSRYRSFVMYYSDLAAHNKIQTLILGGDWLLPALPGGTLPDGSSSNVPDDNDARWSSLLAEVRQHFSGEIYWAINYSTGLVNAPAFINDLDGIYLLWNAPLADIPNPTVADAQLEAGRLLDYEIAPFKATFQKPLVIAIAYPSISGSALGCSFENRAVCGNWEDLNQPNPIAGNYEINIQAQQDMYLAVLMAINERSWIDGVISRGYYLPISLQDGSASINGKPASRLLNLWFHSFIGNNQQ